MSQITTVTFLRYATFRDKYWALSQMYLAHKPLRQVPGQTFYKLMASGSGDGFRIFPDFSVSCLLQVWENEAAAEAFFSSSQLLDDYGKHSTQQWTLYLKCISSRGKWSGVEAFGPTTDEQPEDALITVITRARVKLSKRFSFWKYVPRSHPDVKTIPGLVYMKGVGDIPFAEMATFSLWNDLGSMISFAHHSEHMSAIRQAMEKNWFKEAMFARFYVYRQTGNFEF